MKNINKILFIVFTLILASSCVILNKEENELYDFVKQLIDNPNNIESIILNSKFANKTDDIKKYCILKYTIKHLEECNKNGYKIESCKEKFYRSPTGKLPIMIFIIKSGELKIEFSFIYINNWRLDRIDKIAKTDSFDE